MDISDSSNDAPSRSLYETEQRVVRKKFDRFDSHTKFMENFNPEQSNRERRKLHRKIHYEGKRTAIYSEKGIHLDTGRDLCDCLDEACQGCHFPCPKCRSCKCGHECRQNRKWMYEMIEIEGTKEVVKNKFLK